MLNKIDGNVITYESKRSKLICHIVNTSNVMGSGVAYSLYKKWPMVKREYHEWGNYQYYNTVDNLNRDVEWMLGQVQFLKVEPKVFVANMLGQRSPGGTTIDNVFLQPIRWDCVKECMLRVSEFANKYNCEIVCPYFGCERAGGKEEELLALINEVWNNVEVTLVRFKNE